jgi:hypothetical protein
MQPRGATRAQPMLVEMLSVITGITSLPGFHRRHESPASASASASASVRCGPDWRRQCAKGGRAERKSWGFAGWRVWCAGPAASRVGRLAALGSGTALAGSCLASGLLGGGFGALPTAGVQLCWWHSSGVGAECDRANALGRRRGLMPQWLAGITEVGRRRRSGFVGAVAALLLLAGRVAGAGRAGGGAGQSPGSVERHRAVIRVHPVSTLMESSP